MTSYRLRVYGEPAPQGSKRAYVVNGRAVLVESSSARVKEWRRIVEFSFLAVTEPITGPARVEIEFIMPRPKAMKRTEPHIKRPDLDKIVRSTLDAITSAKAWRDDSQAVWLDVKKRYAEPDEPSGAVIVLEELPA